MIVGAAAGAVLLAAFAAFMYLTRSRPENGSPTSSEEDLYDANDGGRAAIVRVESFVDHSVTQ